MRRATQQRAEQYGVNGTQVAFNFDTDAGALGEVATPAARPPAPIPAPKPQRKRAAQIPEPEPLPRVRRAGKQRAAPVVDENVPVRQEAPKAARRGSKPVVAMIDVPVQALPVDASTANHSAKLRLRQDVRPKRVAAVDAPPVAAIDQGGASLSISDTTKAAPRGKGPTPNMRVRKAKPQVSVTSDVQTLQPDGPLPTLAPASSQETSDVAPALDIVRPLQLTVALAPPTWRYQGPREEADRLYQRRFKTDNVPEPTMIGGTWAYALPALRS